ncbi:MAG: c-type cytochrome [Hyphomicrobiales bacterium]|nr:c-type cytochrome [Hyphomicrobiales bacterium]
MGGKTGTRNTPTVYNAAFQTRLFWDGRAPSLEAQALDPLVNPREMAMPSLAAVANRVRADPAYAPAFRRAFGSDTVTIGRIAQALAAFQRTLVTADSPYDRFLAGAADALSPAQKRGMWLFRTLGCATCHAGPNFGGAPSAFRAFLVDRAPEAKDHGLAADKGRAGPGAANGVWRVPSLRNVALTAPYFHNGSVADLARAVRIMAAAQLNARVGDPPAGARFAPRWSAAAGRFERPGRKRVTEADLADLVAFLGALTSERLARRAGS